MSGTPRLALPFLSAGQAQKEFFHNEALQTLDSLVAGAVEQPPLSTPPATPVLGSCYIVGSSATGAWAGASQSLAAWTSGGWRFIAPAEGMTLYVKSSGLWASYRGGAWELGNLRGSAVLINNQQVVGSRMAAIASPSGGTTIDNEARAALGQILEALRTHGLIET